MPENLPEISINDLKDIHEKVEELLEVKGKDNWASVRSVEGNYEVIMREYSFGTRKTLNPINLENSTYSRLQQSRGLALNEDDTTDVFLKRAIESLDKLIDSDHVRLSEISYFLTSMPAKFAELGFRIPKLQKFFEARGAKAIGYDISDISLLVGKSLGYDVRFYDFNSQEGFLDLSGCDLVASYHMLEHVSDPLRAIHKIYEKMDNGCIFHVEIPVEPDGPRIRYAHLFPFHDNDLGLMLREAGFQIINKSTQTHINGPQIERYVAKK